MNWQRFRCTFILGASGRVGAPAGLSLDSSAKKLIRRPFNSPSLALAEYNRPVNFHSRPPSLPLPFGAVRDIFGLSSLSLCLSLGSGCHHHHQLGHRLRSLGHLIAQYFCSRKVERLENVAHDGRLCARRIRQNPPLCI